jgi:riboflavin kinase/FMN adenylyltransferase
LGWPTANLEIDPHRLIPGQGIYACTAMADDGHDRLAAVSIGVNPTVGDGTVQTVEAYLLDYEGDLYGQRLSLIFHRRLRGEQRFESLEALKDQIGKDVDEVRSFFGG